MTGSGLKNSSTDKVRRSSTDSARSSVTGGIHLHDDLDLRISPHNFKPSSGSVAGADDVSDGSRPGTPLCDERPENLSGPGGVEPRSNFHPETSGRGMREIVGFTSNMRFNVMEDDDARRAYHAHRP